MGAGGPRLDWRRGLDKLSVVRAWEKVGLGAGRGQLGLDSVSGTMVAEGARRLGGRDFVDDEVDD